MRRGQLVHGVSTPSTTCSPNASTTLKAHAAQITCPVLVCDAEGEQLSIVVDEISAQAATCPVSATARIGLCWPPFS